MQVSVKLAGIDYYPNGSQLGKPSNVPHAVVRFSIKPDQIDEIIISITVSEFTDLNAALAKAQQELSEFGSEIQKATANPLV
jgi:DNA-directed RNA polymerase subunit L